ncbi:hypothetical protein SORBI_3001G521700 [Sorghum bicolor]|uniref:Uncharacterized protein n=1 Tax=Sorghum bicolor TaxID=4558 RepID=A0A1Z5SBM7_SORBI|nr:hypothetical protein SORBI_3001G521700 [Sorghum bicolor]
MQYNITLLNVYFCICLTTCLAPNQSAGTMPNREVLSDRHSVLITASGLQTPAFSFPGSSILYLPFCLFASRTGLPRHCDNALVHPPENYLHELAAQDHIQAYIRTG